MFVKKHTHIETEVAKWILLIVAALALIALLSSTAAGANTRGTLPEPRELPEQAREAAQPLTIDPPIIVTTPDQPVMQSVDLASELWLVLGDHETEAWERAIEAWDRLEMPRSTAVWKHVAMAQANLRLLEFDNAAQALKLAAKADPDNAVVHYVTGILHLQRAHYADDWDGGLRPDTTRLASLANIDVVPNTRAMYRLAAIQELERAVELAGNVPWDKPLCMIDWDAAERTAMPVVPPNVGDLMYAMGADNFVGKAHNVLGPLYLEREMLQEAEEHMDQATDLSMNVLNGYEELGERYEAAGLHGAAVRAYLKASEQGHGLVNPVRKAVENVGDLFE